MEEQITPEPGNVHRTVGEQLRAAREAEGLSRADVAAQTKIAERHLEAIEADRFGDLAARTYAIGFSRAYARSLGLDEMAIADEVRRQLDADRDSHHRPQVQSFEPGDPARVPPSRAAWIGILGAVVVIGLLIAYWGNYLSPEARLPDLVSPKPAEPVVTKAAPVAQPSAPVLAQGPVVLTAMAPAIWVKITDGTGAQLFQKELAQGETYTVPADKQAEAKLRTGRPDALQISIGGQKLPMLADKPIVVSEVSLAPDALRAGTSSTPSTLPPSGSPTAVSTASQ